MDNKFTQCFNKLSNKEKKHFRVFAISPFFNKHGKTIELLDQLMTGRCKSKEQLYEQLFPGTTFDQQKLSNIFTYLMRLLQRYIGICHFEAQHFSKELSALAYAYENHQHSFFESQSKVLKQKLLNHPKKNNEYYFRCYQFHDLQDNYGHLHQERISEKNLQTSVDNLDVFYTIEKLKHSCNMLVRQQVLQTFYQTRFLDKLILEIEENRKYYSRYPAVEIYYQIYKMLIAPDLTGNYHALKTLLKDHIALFERNEARDLYTYLQNYCVKKINGGNVAFLEELFAVFKALLKNELLYHNNMLSEWDYKNIVTVACRLEKYKWAKTFIENFKDKIHIKQRSNAYRYNLANYHYSKQDFTEAIKALQDVEFTDVYYAINSRILYIKSYYELNEYDFLLSYLDSFRLYLMRNKQVSANHRKACLAFVSFSRKLVLCKSALPEKRPELVTTLYKKIANSKAVLNKKWFTDQCELMMD